MTSFMLLLAAVAFSTASWVPAVAVRRACRFSRHGQPICNAYEADDGGARDQLERLFRLTAQQSDADELTDGEQPPKVPGQINDLPLWVTGWAALPGFRQMVHITQPSQVHMFQQLVADAAEKGEPATFGQLLIKQKANGEALAIMPGGKVVGTVMEVDSIHPLQGGRLAISVRAICRFRVLRPTASSSSSSHHRADVVLIPDYEEMSEVRDWPWRSTEVLPKAVRAEATRAAAAAASMRWVNHELDRQTASGSVGGRMADESGNGDAEAPVPLNLQLSMAAARDEAHDAAEEAARAVLANAVQQPPCTGEECPPQGDDALTQLFEEQGNAVEGFAKEALKTGLRVPKALFSRTGPPAGRAFLLALEQALWTELVSVRRLELKYQRKHGKDADRLALSDELLQLMPPAPADGWTVQMPSTPPATEWLRRWEYPPVRRAQRLSFMMATLLPALDRQRLLQASSVRERLQLSIVHLCEVRRRLVARAALEGPAAEGDGSSPEFGI